MMLETEMEVAAREDGLGEALVPEMEMVLAWVWEPLLE